MVKILSILTFLFFELSLVYTQESEVKIIAEQYETNKFNVAIFPKESIQIIKKRRFTPTRADIDSGEISMINILSTIVPTVGSKTQVPFIVKNYSNYIKQYFGYIDSNGDKILEINCLWKNDKRLTKDWLLRKISVKDGGSHFWSIKYNLSKNSLFDMRINGHS